MASRADNFNRADSTTAIGSPSDGGGAWTTEITTWGISSNRAYDVGANANGRAVLDAATGEMEVSAKLYGMSSARAGLLGRYSDANNYWIAQILADASLVRLYRVEGGGFNLEANVTQSFSDGDTATLSMSGTSIAVKVNGVSVATLTSSFNQTATKGGIRSDGYAAPRWEDFAITDLGGGGATGHPAMRRFGMAGPAAGISRCGLRVF